MAAHYLSDKNNNIVLAAAEVLANLSLTDAIQGRANMGRMKQELEMMMALFNSLDLDDTTNIRLLNAVLGFIANIIVNNDVVEFFMQDKNFVIRLAKLVEQRQEEEIWHRCLYTLDEVSLFLDDEFEEYRIILKKNSTLATKLS